jgi:hypothetical protein
MNIASIGTADSSLKQHGEHHHSPYAAKSQTTASRLQLVKTLQKRPLLAVDRLLQRPGRHEIPRQQCPQRELAYGGLHDRGQSE